MTRLPRLARQHSQGAWSHDNPFGILLATMARVLDGSVHAVPMDDRDDRPEHQNVLTGASPAAEHAAPRSGLRTGAPILRRIVRGLGCGSRAHRAG